MTKANYHTHSTFDDGKSSLRDMTETALEEGFSVLGFSGHSPLPFEAYWTLHDVEGYLDGVAKLKAEYSGRIEILCGMEIDWLPGVSEPKNDYFRSLPLDYRLGSMHFAVPDNAEPFTVDQSEAKFLEAFRISYGNDGKRLVREYYESYAAMVNSGGFDIACHFDLIRRNNRDNLIFDESARWYRDTVFSCLDAVAAAGIVVEVNTGGMARKAMTSVYPSAFALKRMRELSIPVTVGLDAHHVDHLKGYHETAMDAIREAGYKTIRVFGGGKWKDEEIQTQ